jgi:hypothetical protein
MAICFSSRTSSTSRELLREAMTVIGVLVGGQGSECLARWLSLQPVKGYAVDNGNDVWSMGVPAGSGVGGRRLWLRTTFKYGEASILLARLDMPCRRHRKGTTPVPVGSQALQMLGTEALVAESYTDSRQFARQFHVAKKCSKLAKRLRVLENAT